MTNHHPTVSVLGAGAVGSAVARSLLSAGHRTIVWNRTPAKADSLVDAGAIRAAMPNEALTAADLAIVALTDYAAVGSMLDALGAADLIGRTVVVLVTGSPDVAAKAAERFAALGADYLDGGIQATPDAIGTSSAMFLLSGSRSAFERHRATLQVLGQVRFVGEQAGAAATWDLALFGAWYDAQLGLLRAVDLARAAGIDLDGFAETLHAQLDHVPASTAQVVAEVRAGAFPAGPASLAEHLPVLRRLVDARAGAGLGDGGLEDVVKRVEQVIAAGHRASGLTALIG